MGKYKVPLERREEKEKREKELKGLLFYLITYIAVGFISAFILTGAVASFIAAGSGVGQALIMGGFLTGVFSAFITILILENSIKKNK